MNDLDWIRKWAYYKPEKIATIDLDTNQEYSYRDLLRYSYSITNYLEQNFKEGDRIAVLAEQSTFMVALFAACQRLGIILAPLNYRLSNAEISVLLSDCAPSLVIYSELFEEKLSLSKDYFNCNSQLSFIEKSSKVYITKEFLEKRYSIKEDLPVFLFYTSGTTNEPKGVLYTNKMLFWNSLNTTMQLGLTGEDKTVNVLPPYHTSGWNILVMPLIHNGATVAMLKKFDASDVLKQLQLTKASVFICLPTILQMIANDTMLMDADLSELRFIITGGEYMNKKAIEFWNNQKKIFIRPGYGLTEAGPSLTSLHQDKLIDKQGSIGKPNFYVEIDIKDSKGNSVGDHIVGELCVKGHIVTPGYWNNSVATKDKLRDGWLYTGDLGYRDEEGYLYLKGRIDDMYISGGENIFPQEIEQVLNQHSEIEKSFVLPVHHAVWGKVGAAFIKSKNTNLSIKEVEEFLKDKLAKYKYPRHYIFMKDFPATSIGKISRKELHKLFQEQVSSQHNIQ